MSDMSVEPCPFCGSFKAIVASEYKAVYVKCQDCGAEGPPVDTTMHQAREEVRRRWNLRPSPNPGTKERDGEDDFARRMRERRGT